MRRALDTVVRTDEVQVGKEEAHRQFRAALEKAFPKSEWKQDLLFRLWQSELDQGYRLADLSRAWFADGSERARLPYLLHLPREVVNTVIATAKARGLKPGHRYLVVPLKSLATTVIKDPAQHAFLIVSLGAGGVITDVLNLNIPDPLLNKTDPAELKSDEVYVIVKLASGEVREGRGGGTNAQFAKIISELKARSPASYVVVDLSSEAGVNDQNYRARVESIVRSQVIGSGKKVKRIIVASHGSSGQLGGDRGGEDVYYRLSDFADVLAPLKPALTSASEVHFTGCDVAADDGGRIDVDEFARKLLPPGGMVEAPAWTYLRRWPELPWDAGAQESYPVCRPGGQSGGAPGAARD